MATPSAEGLGGKFPAKESTEGAVLRKEIQEKGSNSAMNDVSQPLAEKKMHTAGRSSLPSERHRGRGGSRAQRQEGRGKQQQTDRGEDKISKDKAQNPLRVRVPNRNRWRRGGPKVSRAGADLPVAVSDVEAASRGRGGRKASAGTRGGRGRPAVVSDGTTEPGGAGEGGQNSSNSEGALAIVEGGGKEPSSVMRVKPGKSLPTDTSARKEEDRREKPPQAVPVTCEESATTDIQKYSKAKKLSTKPPRRAQSAPVPSVQSDVLSQQLLSGTYECVVCCGRVRLEHSVWSCINCYHIFHLHCIKKWAKRPPDQETGGRLHPSGE